MGASRKRDVFNQFVSEHHERKQLKEEQQRMERIQKIESKKKQAHLN